MKPPTFELRIRVTPDDPKATVWLLRVDGAARSQMLFGQIFPDDVEHIIAAIGLPVDRELLPPSAPVAPPAEKPAKGKKAPKPPSMFDDEPESDVYKEKR